MLLCSAWGSETRSLKTSSKTAEQQKRLTGTEKGFLEEHKGTGKFSDEYGRNQRRQIWCEECPRAAG